MGVIIVLMCRLPGDRSLNFLRITCHVLHTIITNTHTQSIHSHCISIYFNISINQSIKALVAPPWVAWAPDVISPVHSALRRPIMFGYGKNCPAYHRLMSTICGRFVPNVLFVRRCLFLPLDEAVASIALFVIVSMSGGRERFGGQQNNSKRW